MASTPFHYSVSLRGFHFEDSNLTVNLASDITVADVGKAVTIDTSDANKFKLAGDGDPIVGRLEVVEDRSVEGQLVGTVAFRFANLLPIAEGETVAVGNTVVGGGDGTVKALKDQENNPVADYSMNFVAEVIGTNAVVVKI
jgi:hypothetical protein